MMKLRLGIRVQGRLLCLKLSRDLLESCIVAAYPISGVATVWPTQACDCEKLLIRNNIHHCS